MEIVDGTGKAFSLKVDDENMGHALAVTSEDQHHANDAHGEAYTMDIDGIQPDGANYWVAIIKNTSDIEMHITSVTGWVASFSNTQIYEAYIGGAFTYASNGTVVVPANCNAGSGKTATGDFYVNDGTGNITTVTTGTLVGRFIFDATVSKWSKDSNWILPKNQCFMIWSNLAEKLNGYISFFYHNNQWSNQG